ncbi:unnamed protein product [Clonostachys rhizophaga]|uniref:Uncharacterized protein n=1 Tax=Clonostachys rhizophaga TaxID=160324 RepID=A0A9N9W1G8_9HYPO|nr:unnamed protein product [Clonostachys rhizophaga]
MAPANTIDDTFIPEFLYHTCLTVDEHDVQTLEDIPRLYVLGSHGTLEAAKKCAFKALATLGYEEADFALYQTRPHGVEEWEHGNGTIVYAKAPTGQEFLVRIDTKLNIEDLPALPDGSLRLPRGTDHLHFIVQTQIKYTADRAISSEIQGAYLKRNDALEAAKWCLLDESSDPKVDYAQFEINNDLEPKADWPFGEDVLIHAVTHTGENYLISLVTPPSSYRRLDKHRKKRGTSN